MGYNLSRKKRVSKKSGKRLRWRALDKNLIHYLSKRRYRFLTSFMRLISHIGDGFAWFFLCILFMIIGFLQEGEFTTSGEVSTGISILFGLLIQGILQMIVKRIFNRQRPYVKHDDISKAIKPPDRFSFPSGHTAGAFTVSFVLYYYHPFISIPFFILSGLIAFSRMYLGVHYLSDILAGIVLGFISSSLGIYLSLLIST